MIKQIRSFMVWAIVGALVMVPVGLSAKERTGSEMVPTPKNNGVYVELLGNGILYSLNHERRASEHCLLRIGGNIALTNDKYGWEILGENGTGLLFGTMNYIAPIRNSNWAFEAGIGPLLWFYQNKVTHVMVTSTLGVRYQPRKGNLLVRFGITPFFYIPWAGLSVGVRF